MRLNALQVIAALSAFFVSVSAYSQSRDKSPATPPPLPQQTPNTVNDSNKPKTRDASSTILIPSTSTQTPASAPKYEVQDAIVLPPSARGKSQGMVQPTIPETPSVKDQQEQQRLEEQKKLEEQKRIEEQKKLEEQKRIEEQKKLEEQKRLEEQKKLEEQKRLEEQKKLDEQKKLEEQKRLEEQRRLEAQKKREEEKRRERELAASLDTTARVLFGVSSNLLLDAVTAVNVGVEVPFGRHWGAHLGYTTPWWSFSDQFYSLRIQCLDLGVRYYFKPWTARGSDVYRGWFLSAAVGAGKYNLAWAGKGVEGKAIIGGIGGGYTWAFGDWWRLDTSFNLGMMLTDFNRYDLSGTSELPDAAIHSRLPDPAALKVTLTYLIHSKKK